MKAEGKGCEPNRFYLRDGRRAAINHLGPATLARNVRPYDVTAWRREIHKAGVKLQHPRAYLSAAFSRAMKADNDPTAEVGAIQLAIDANPVFNVGGRSGVVSRDRKLSLDEFKAFWREFLKHTQPQTASAARKIIAMGRVQPPDASRRASRTGKDMRNSSQRAAERLPPNPSRTTTKAFSTLREVGRQRADNIWVWLDRVMES